MNVTTGTKRKQVIKAIQCAVGLVLAWAGQPPPWSNRLRSKSLGSLAQRPLFML